MEIRTTMVRFSVPNKVIEKRTDKAILFCFNDDKIWIPCNKLCLSEAADNTTELIMPKWLYMKTNLPLYTTTVEFCHVQSVDNDTLKDICTNK